MQAMVFTRPGVVELLDVDEPIPAPGEVVVDVAVAGICGSELHGIASPGFRVPPLIMGHEFAGVTADGRRVVVNPLVACGDCDMCAAGKGQMCRRRQLLGVHRPGGFAQQVAVPASQLHDLPDGLDWTAAAIIEPLANGVHAWHLVADQHPRRVAVIGAGAIGLVCLIVGRELFGVTDITVTDLSESRREAAKQAGASAVTQTLTGEFDIVFDAVGNAATRSASIAALRPGGTAVWLGLAGPDAGFDAPDLVRAEKRVLGSFAYTAAEFAQAIHIAAAGCPTHWAQTFPLHHGPTVFTELMRGRTEPVKAVLTPQPYPAEHSHV